MAGKHTLRRNLYGSSYMPYSLVFDRVDRFSVSHEDGSKEVAVSTVDLLLDDSDSFVTSSALADRSWRQYYYGACRNGNLNKHGLWDTILEELEGTCIKRVERMNVKINSYETIYSVPVIGHKLFLPPLDDDHVLGAYNEMRTEQNQLARHEKLNKSTVKKIKRNPNQFMLWEGKYYDTSLVYLHNPQGGNSLKPLGDVKAPKQNLAGPPGIIEFIKNVSYQNYMRHREYQLCRIVHSDQTMSKSTHSHYNGQNGGGWKQSCVQDYLEINLTYPRYVTHIGTTGEYPATCIFPTRRTVGKSRMRRFRAYNTGNEEDEERISTCLSRNGNGVKLSKFASYVNILKEDEFSLAWVTTYEVHYRHTVTNKWTLLCVTSANSDAFSEQVLDLRPYFNAKDGLLTQYLRIRPLEYIHQPKMRVSVYGIDPQYNCGINGSIVKGITTARASGDRSAAGRQTLVEAGRIGEGKEEGDDEGEYSTLGAEDVPTIEYAVAHGVSADNRKYVRDALSTGRYWDRYGQGKNPKHLKNSRNRNFIREEHREYYKNFD